MRKKALDEALAHVFYLFPNAFVVHNIIGEVIIHTGEQLEDERVILYGDEDEN